MKKHCLVFDLSYNSDLKFYIPSGIIVEIEHEKLGYILKIANEETLASYGLELDETAVQLVSIAQKLNPGRLQKKYNTGNRIPKSLNALMADEQGKKIIFQFVSNSLQQFYKLLLSTCIPLVIHSEKNEIAEKYRLTFSKEKLAPKLYFHKKEEGIDYRLSLWKDTNELIPCQEKFTILLDQPSYVIHNQTVYELQHINANKLRPFLAKEIIQIPHRSSATYFNTFIKKVIKKTPIEADGFEVITNHTCTSCYIQPTTTIYSKVYLLELFFVYDNHTFSIMDNAQKHVQLHHDEDGHFKVFETLRNKNEEQKYIDMVKNVGIKFLDSNLASFWLDIKNMDTYDNIAKLLQVKDQLKENAIHTELQLHKLLINEHIAAITTHYQENKDWFDVQMNIDVGEFQFPFTNLVSHLKSGKRLYQLPDGSHFLIPKEWFSRYKPLMNLGKVKKNTLQIQKNQFTLLEETGIAKKEEFSKDIIAYQTTGNVKATLRAYQEEGVNWLAKNYQMQLGSCLADDMGLGKTLQTLAYLDFVFSFFEADFVSDEEPSFPLDLFSIAETKKKTLKALIVSPSSLTFNWKNEAQKFCPHFSNLSYVGQNRQLLQKEIPSTDLVFTSYGVLLRDIDFFKTLAFRFIIIDESQHIKNRKSKIFKAINRIQATHKVSLSGTPIENSLSDLWSQMQFINPHLLGSYAFFNEHFKKPIEKEKQDERIHELKTLIQPYLLRRTKTEVAKDLPELAEQLYYTEMASEQAKLYEKEKSKVRNYLIDKKLSTDVHASKQNTLSILNALLKLRQLANHPKLIKKEAKSGKFEDATAYLETLLRAKQKTLIFSSFTSHLQLYTDWCDEQNIAYQLLTGKTNVKDREKAVHDFENKDESLLFFISLKAGGTGLNLTQASYVIILDPWWNPFAELQAIGRAHRIGQTQKVNVVRFIAKNTIEEKINQLQQTKKYLSDSIIENQIMVEILNDLEEFLD